MGYTNERSRALNRAANEVFTLLQNMAALAEFSGMSMVMFNHISDILNELRQACCTAPPVTFDPKDTGDD